MAIPPVNMEQSCCKKERCLFGENVGQVYDVCDPCQGQGTFNAETCDCNLGTGFVSIRYFIIERQTNRYLCTAGTPLDDACGGSSPILRSFFASNATLLSYGYGGNSAVLTEFGATCDCPEGVEDLPATILELEYVDHDDEDTEKTFAETTTAGGVCRNDISVGRTVTKYV